MIKISTYCLLLLVSFISCKTADDREYDDQIKIAEIGNRVLTSNDIEGIGNGSVSKEDSLQLVRAYVDNWLRNNAVLLEAESDYTNTKHLDRLVEEYRNSLLTYEYESRIVAESLDTMVTEKQIQDYYDEFGDQFVLPGNIIKYWLAIVPAKSKGIDRFFLNWKKSEKEKIAEYCTKRAELFHLKDEVWHTESILHSFIPEGLFKNKKFEKGAILQKHKDEKEYFLKIVDIVTQDDVPPLTYIESKIEKVILNYRKQELLRSIRENLYKKQLHANNVKMYINH